MKPAPFLALRSDVVTKAIVRCLHCSSPPKILLGGRWPQSPLSAWALAWSEAVQHPLASAAALWVCVPRCIPARRQPPPVHAGLNPSGNALGGVKSLSPWAEGVL